MHVPSHFAESDPEVLRALIRAHPLGTWVTQDGDTLVANHIPFLLDADRGPHGTLVGHVARANPVWRTFSTRVRSLVVFQGVDTYVTPSFYPSKRAHGKVVPTWNYAVVHAQGMPRAIEDRDWLLQLLERLVTTHEATEALPWKIADAPADYVDGLLRVIVGIEIPVDALTGKWKVSQNRPDADRRGVADGLAARGGAAAVEMAALVRRHIVADGDG